MHPLATYSCGQFVPLGQLLSLMSGWPLCPEGPGSYNNIMWMAIFSNKLSMVYQCKTCELWTKIIIVHINIDACITLQVQSGTMDCRQKLFFLTMVPNCLVFSYILLFQVIASCHEWIGSTPYMYMCSGLYMCTCVHVRILWTPYPWDGTNVTRCSN